MKISSICLILLIVSCASAFTIGSSLSIRTPKNDFEAVDYEFSINTHLDSLMLSEVTYERQNGKCYHGVDVLLWRTYKYLKFSGSYADIQEDDINRISIDGRYSYPPFSIGVANVWSLHPTQELVFGIRYENKFGIPYIFPVKVFFISDSYTADFKTISNHAELKVSAKLSSILSGYIKYKQRYYSKWNFQTKIGIEVEL
jgi:hypothetical protein